ncbi:Helicase MOV-10, partial [Halocaridina rubra]
NMMKEGLTENNHVEWFQTMLWIEEMQMELDIQYYSMPEAPLKKVPRIIYPKAECVELEVLGLAENRPSVLKGDSVFVTYVGKKKPVYEGIVHQVNEKSVYLAFNPEFMETFIDNLKVNVEFTFNRHPLRVSHRALILSKELSLNNLTFPTLPPSSGLPEYSNILLYNRKIETNPEQKEAVSNILAGTSKPAPYIIFGPPGTGKTVTVVEAIKQVYKLHPGSRILAAAPANAAADLIAQRLLEHIIKKDMIRLHAPSRSVASVPNNLFDISNIRDQQIYIPSDAQLKSFRVIICTFVTSARIASSSFPPGHITHVFLDECGHAMEPECLAAMAGIVEKGQVVLAGDPYPLGPVIRNQRCFTTGKLFTKNGLDKSILERLMERDMYKANHGQFNRKVVTKLRNSYRSHKDILKLPNEMFYDGELNVCADPLITTSMCSWKELPKKNFPLIFHAVRGKDEREGNSPSFFNSLEVSTVIDYTRKLLESKNPKVMAKEIGIITPYRRQVEKASAFYFNLTGFLCKWTLTSRLETVYLKVVNKKKLLFLASLMIDCR